MNITKSLGAQNATAAGMWDIMGMTASMLCITHCVAMPFILPFLISWGLVAVSNESVHHTLLAVIMALGVLAFLPGYKKHERGVIFAIASVGLASLVFGAFYAEEVFGSLGETPFTISGGAMLVTAHWLNRRFCKICPVCDETADCCSGEQHAS